ncbi:hypothetical protein [Paenibacillus sp. CMAA1364]
MKRIEIKEIGAISAFKATLYIACIPLAIMSLIGILMTILGIVLGQTELLYIGIPYIIIPVFLLGIYGVFSMLIAVVYNKFTKKFGGLEIVIQEKVELNADLHS